MSRCNICGQKECCGAELGPRIVELEAKLSESTDHLRQLSESAHKNAAKCTELEAALAEKDKALAEMRELWLEAQAHSEGYGALNYFDKELLSEKEKENAELHMRMHFIRDNIRQVEWHHLEMEHPEVAGWFSQQGLVKGVE